MYIDYYMSPIGVVKILCNKKQLVGLRFEEVVCEDIKVNNITDVVKKQLDEYFNGSRISFDVPILIEGTDFQKQCYLSL